MNSLLNDISRVNAAVRQAAHVAVARLNGDDVRWMRLYHGNALMCAQGKFTALPRPRKPSVGGPTFREVYQQHVAATAALLSKPIWDESAAVQTLGLRSGPLPRHRDYYWGVELRRGRSDRDGRVWRPFEMPHLAAEWFKVTEDDCATYFGEQDDGLFWLQTIFFDRESDLVRLRGLMGSDESDDESEGGDLSAWQGVRLSLCLGRRRDGKLLRLAHNVSAFEEEQQDDVTDWFFTFTLGPAIVRLEATLDATAIGYRGQAAELHLAIDPRDADDRSYMIEDLDGLLRLVESRAAEPLWC